MNRFPVRQACRLLASPAALVTVTTSFLFFTPTTLTAHDEAAEERPPVKVADEVAYRPTALPDRILLSLDTEPATTLNVTWRTDTTVAHAMAQIAEAEDGPAFVNVAKQFEAATVSFVSDLGPAHYHEIRIDGLTPKTKYVYRVGDGVNWSEWLHFTTASDSPEPFTFIYFGDAQNDVKSHWSRVIREAYQDAPAAAFLLHAGDLVNVPTRDAEWGEWFYAGGHIHRMIPCVATPGNHEYAKILSPEGRTTGRELARHWRPTFAFPQNGPEGLEETVYWIDYQGARIISLNSNENYMVQVKWLEKVLEDNPNRWTIITFHHPIYSAKAGRDNLFLRMAWQPLFDRFRIDLVLQGHDHTYARSQMMTAKNLPTGVNKQDAESGTVYVVSVSGPKMYDLGRRPFMRRAAEDTQLYQVITVDGDELRYKACTATGRPYDAFTLRKREGQPNELIEQIPDTPERRRAVEAAAGS